MGFSKATLWSFIVSVMLTGARSDLHQSALVTLQVQPADTAAHLLEALGYDVAGKDPNEGWVEVVVLSQQSIPTMLRDLRRFDMKLIQPPLIESTQPYRQTVNTALDDGPAYPDVDETLHGLNELARLYPDHAHVFNLTNLLAGEPTEQGRDLFALQVSMNPKQIEDEPKIIIVGEHHARELMTHTAVLDSARDYLRQITSGDESYLVSAEQASVWFVPMVNPDGLDHVFQKDRMWRKNRRENSDSSIGVDLNRNYGFQWGACGTNSPYGSSETYRGTAAFSESESTIMDRLNALLRAQYLISYHSSGDEVLYPYVCGELAEKQRYMNLRDRLAGHLNFGRRLASSSGEDFEHHYAQYGTISFLLEIGRSFQPSYSEYESRVWPKVKKVLPFLLQEISEKPFLNLRVIDATGSAVKDARLTIREIEFREGEIRTTDQFGRYRWQLDPGAYHLTVVSDMGSADVVVNPNDSGFNSETVVQLQ